MVCLSSNRLSLDFNLYSFHITHRLCNHPGTPPVPRLTPPEQSSIAVFTMAATPDVKRELELIENVEWRILSASSDEGKLQQLLKVYLAPLLVKAGSENASVRNKVSSKPASSPYVS